jgi:hypothetical protein
MDKLIFVCYQHGFGGENLSYRISQNILCKKLAAKNKKGRTIIKNDIFNKVLLGFNDNFKYNFNDKEELCQKVLKNFKNKINKIKKYNVVPSHIDVTILQKYFINSFFVTIEPPKTYAQYKKYRKHLYDSFWLYKTEDIKEYVGEIYSKIETYYKQKTPQEIKIFTHKILLDYKNKLSFGQIQCVINNIEPTTKNMKIFFNSIYCKNNFYNFTKIKNQSNVLSIPYKSVKDCEIEYILKYFKII